MKHHNPFAGLDVQSYVGPVEKNIPIPTERHFTEPRIPVRQIFPLAQMAVGDSFAVKKLPGEKLIRTANRVSTAASGYKRQMKGAVVFETRQVSDTEVRCWRKM